MRITMILLLAVIPSFAFCQFGVSFHQSNLPFVGFSYDFKSKLRPELRIGADYYFEYTTVEAVLTYDFIRTKDYEFYAGLGLRLDRESAGAVIPVGLNIYPLPVKQFGFHIELAPIIQEGPVLRGSWGIRYRFKKND